ncbi:hypothetical protein QVG61_07720 [Thiohalobacter sp. IOR34]|uniref:hypothetical protein n=1 Tax=Thiohalobacter sp. IOR34 TaxID=3057176 RepID=UPI0025B0171A|nr:hypothetical protein [Thiohalobacter sp. IOR34]WJW74405.1 hypothetical protein QVG61_07720 [Thiohalobacter sp. IOR34]
MPTPHRSLQILGLCLLWLLAGTLAAAGRMELIELKQRTAEELIPVLEPLLQEGEAVSGQGYRLVLQADETRLQELKRLVERLDRAAVRLRFTVRRGSVADLREDELRGSGGIQVENGDTEAALRARLYGTRRREAADSHFTVTGLAGSPVYIASRLSIPVVVTTRRQLDDHTWVTDSVEYEDSYSGFYALAEVRGDQVLVSISPQREAFGSGGIREGQAIHTRLRGRLGEWLEIGGMGEARQEESGRLLGRTRSRTEQQNRLWLKVERLP